MAKLSKMRARFKPADETKRNIPTFVVTTCLYIAVGLLGWLVPRADYFGIFELPFFTEGGFGTTILDLLYPTFGIYLIILPTYFQFLYACRPFHMKKGVAIAFLVIGLVLNAGTIVLAILLGTLGSGAFFYIELIISELGLILGYLFFSKKQPFWHIVVCVVFTLLLSVVGLLVFAASLLAVIVYFLYALLAGGKMSAKVIAGDSEFVRSYRDTSHYLATGERAAPHYRYSATITNSMGCDETILFG